MALGKTFTVEYVGFFSSPRMHQLNHCPYLLVHSRFKSQEVCLAKIEPSARGGGVLIDRATKIGWIWGGRVPHRKIRPLLARDEGRNAGRQK